VEKLAGNTQQFAERFNSMFPGAHRSLAAEDVREMVRCGLIRRHGYYEWLDLQTVRGILQYERSRAQRLGRRAAGLCEVSLQAQAGTGCESPCHVES
jgi:hypothetical protein